MIGAAIWTWRELYRDAAKRLGDEREARWLVEESAGLTIRGHVPEKDGVIAGLLMAEMVARRGRSIGEQQQ